MLLGDWPSPSMHSMGPTDLLSYSCEAPFALMRASQSIVQASCCRKHANSRYTLSKALVFKDDVLAADSRSFLPESATSVLATLHHEVLWQYSGLLLAQRFGNATGREAFQMLGSSWTKNRVGSVLVADANSVGLFLCHLLDTWSTGDLLDRWRLAVLVFAAIFGHGVLRVLQNADRYEKTTSVSCCFYAGPTNKHRVMQL